jgi:hypothetical protein
MTAGLSLVPRHGPIAAEQSADGEKSLGNGQARGDFLAAVHFEPTLMADRDGPL